MSAPASIGAGTFGSACLLAGGEGRRLGGLDKQLIEGPDGRPLGPALAEALAAVFPDTLVATKTPGPYAGLPVRALADIIPGFGILSGLHAALRAASSDWVYLAACDMPALSPAWIGALRGRIAEAEAAGRRPLACLARFGTHLEPFQAFYSKRLLPLLEATLGSSPGEARRPSVRELLESAERGGLGSILLVPEDEARRITPDWGLFFNINLPAELEGFSRSRP